MYRLKNKAKLKVAVTNAIENEALPLLQKINNIRFGDDVEEGTRQMVVNGFMCKSIHIIVSRVHRVLGILSEHGEQQRIGSQEENDTVQIELNFRKRSRTAGCAISDLIRRIKYTNDNVEGVSQEIIDNRCNEYCRKILSETSKLSDTMKEHVFNSTCIDYQTVVNTVQDILSNYEQTNLLEYLSSAEDEIITDLESRETKQRTFKVQQAFRECPRRAIRYYVDKANSPNCNIPLNTIHQELGARWANQQFDPDTEGSCWEIIHRMNESDRKYLNRLMTSRDHFEEVIKSRDITSAHGPDGIGYWALQLNIKAGTSFMIEISKLILKYGRMPTIWNAARTILLYKKGDPDDINNWRPITIASCLYRTWTCALAWGLQAINRSTRLFNENQKGFIRGINGCQEHSIMASEIIHDANRNNKSLYVVTIDFSDAFGSVPHKYIMHTLKQMNFPENIVNILKCSYREGYTKVRIGGQQSDEIDMRKGTKQGCPLSPLIFNFCLNPLLDAIEEHGEGYQIGEVQQEQEDDKQPITVKVQAYADDVILFAETKEGMRRNLEIVQRFVQYSKLTINTNKCHSISYLYENRRRFYDNEPFYIGEDPIPISTLNESVEYLGVGTATSHRVRRLGVNALIEETKNLIIKIGESKLSLNQKIYAIKVFAIPKLDYALSNSKCTFEKLKEIDTLIRSTIDRHVGGTKIPVNLFYTHWKDGGFSLIPMQERARILITKSFVSMCNSRNQKTKEAMKEFIESERNFRGIPLTQHDSFDEVSEHGFLNWNMETNNTRGTDTIIFHAFRASKKLDFNIKMGDSGVYIEAQMEMPNKKRHNNAEEIGSEGNEEANTTNYVLQNATLPREIIMILTKRLRKSYQEMLISNQGIGHTFINLENEPYANVFMSDYRHPMNDTIRSWIVKARCNLLFTGKKAIKYSNQPIQNCPKCPYCWTTEEDTIMHRLNGCKSNLQAQTKRHNSVQNVIIDFVKDRRKDLTFKINSSVMIDNVQLSEEYRRLKPDITLWNDNELYIVEISCPYGNMTKDDEGNEINSLDKVYKQKVEKYANLVNECREKFDRRTKLIIVIVSSLGAIHKRSIAGIKKLLRLKKNKKKGILNIALRRMSIVSCISSYFIYHGMEFRTIRSRNREDTEDTEGNEGVSGEEEEELDADEEDADTEEEEEDDAGYGSNEEEVVDTMQDDPNIYGNAVRGNVRSEEQEEEEEEMNEEESSSQADAGAEECGNSEEEQQENNNESHNASDSEEEDLFRYLSSSTDTSENDSQNGANLQ